MEADRSLRTPRAAAVAGIVFSVLLATALVLVASSLRAGVTDTAPTIGAGGRTRLAVAVNLVPFAGIAFLWFIGVVRDRIGQQEDRFFSTVFLASGVLFVAMLFVGVAVIAGLLSELARAGSVPSSELWTFGRRVSLAVLSVYAMRMAAVFAITTATILRRTVAAPSWLMVTGYAVGAVLLLTGQLSPWIGLLFPAWILAVSVDTLIVVRRT